MAKKGETKVQTVGGQDDTLADGTAPEPVVTTSEPEPKLEPVVEPEPVKDMAKTEHKDWEREYKALSGSHKLVVDELKTLKQDRLDFSNLNQKVTEQGETLVLITDILSENAVDNEELGNRVKQAKQKQEEDKKRIEQVRVIGQDMGTLVQVAEKVAGKTINLSPSDEALKPAWEAASRGDKTQAIKLTTLAIETKISALRLAKPAETTEPDKSKKKVPVITSTTGHVSDTANMTPREKIKYAIQQRE